MNYEPSPNWQSFGANSSEEFINKFVLKGHFHSGVDKNVVESYKTIEALQIHAYYEYKFLDVVLTQLMGLFEMAVKLRCEEVGIEKTYLDKNHKTQKKDLNRFINDLIKQELTPEFKSIMHHVREIRNYAMHPNRNDTVGTIALSPILITINLINQLFLSKEHHLENKKELIDFRKQFSFKNTELFKLQTVHGVILVYYPRVIDTFKIDQSWIRAVSFEPVLINTKEKLSTFRVPDPIIRFFKELEINRDGISGFDVVSQRSVSIERTTEPENIHRFQEHIQDLSELDSSILDVYKNSKLNRIDYTIQKYIYRNCWS